MVTMQLSKIVTNSTFCISGFCVNPRRTNSVTLFLFSMCYPEGDHQVSEAANKIVDNEFEKIERLCQKGDALLNNVCSTVHHTE